MDKKKQVLLLVTIDGSGDNFELEEGQEIILTDNPKTRDLPKKELKIKIAAVYERD